eukprot:Clim_evm8s248 gene=Clim_evmTU8s248
MAILGQNVSYIFFGAMVAYAMNALVINQPAPLVPAKATSPPKKILFMMPDSGYDVIDASAAWWTLSNVHHELTFATSSGNVPQPCELQLGTGNAYWDYFYGTGESARKEHAQMTKSAAYNNPVSFSDVLKSIESKSAKFDGLFIPGGYCTGYEKLIFDKEAHAIAELFLYNDRVVATLGEGIAVLGTAPATGDHAKQVAAENGEMVNASVLVDRKLTGPNRVFEFFLRHTGAILFPGKLFYDEVPSLPSVEHIVKNSAGTDTFSLGPLQPFQSLKPGSRKDFTHTHVMRDGNLLTGRYWTDAYMVALGMAKTLELYDSTSWVM